MEGDKFIKDIIKKAFLELTPGGYNILITMNLPALGPQFFASFKGLVTPEEHSKMAAISSPIVRVYCFVKKSEDELHVTAKRLVERHVDMDLNEEIECIDYVRNVAPNKEMMCVQVRLSRRILVGPKRAISNSSSGDPDPKRQCSDAL